MKTEFRATYWPNGLGTTLCNILQDTLEQPPKL